MGADSPPDSPHYRAKPCIKNTILRDSNTDGTDEKSGARGLIRDISGGRDRNPREGPPDSSDFLVCRAPRFPETTHNTDFTAKIAISAVPIGEIRGQDRRQRLPKHRGAGRNYLLGI
jgi:hypothetical protein